MWISELDDGVIWATRIPKSIYPQTPLIHPLNDCMSLMIFLAKFSATMLDVLSE